MNEEQMIGPSEEAVRIASALAVGAVVRTESTPVPLDVLIAFCAGCASGEEQADCLALLCRSEAARQRVVQIRDHMAGANSGEPKDTALEANVARVLGDRFGARAAMAVGLRARLLRHGLAGVFRQSSLDLDAMAAVLQSVRDGWRLHPGRAAFALTRSADSAAETEPLPGLVAEVTAAIDSTGDLHGVVTLSEREPGALARSLGTPITVVLDDSTGRGLPLMSCRLTGPTMPFSVGEFAGPFGISGEDERLPLRLVRAEGGPADDAWRPKLPVVIDPALSANGPSELALVIGEGPQARDGQIRFTLLVEPWLCERVEGAKLRIEARLGLISHLLAEVPIADARAGAVITIAAPLVPDGRLDTLAFIQARIVRA